MLAAALDGIDNQLECPFPLNNVNVYLLTAEERVARNIPELPGSLAEAMKEFELDSCFQTALGPAIFEAFSRAKWEEIDEYRTNVTDWEVGRYLELA
jgi:glutamine synthetase